MFVSPVHRAVIPATGIIEDGLIHRWNCDEGSGTTLNDPYGGAHASLTTDYAWVTGSDGQRSAIDFNGVNGTPGAPFTEQNVGTVWSLTWRMFARGGWKNMITGPSDQMMMRIDGTDKIEVRLSESDKAAVNVGYLLNIWINFGMARNDLVCTGYREGVDQGNSSLTANSDTLISRIARLAPNIYNVFDGSLEDIRVYNRILTPTEFASIAAGTG